MTCTVWRTVLFYAAISVDVTRMILSGEKKYRGTLQTYAHVSKPVEMRILEKTIRGIESGGYRNAGHSTVTNGK